MLEAKTTEEIQQLYSGNPLVPVLLDNAGFTGVILSLENKDLAVHQIMVHEVLLKRKLEVEDIRRGLESLSLSTFPSSFPSLYKQIFPSAEDFIIKAEMITSQIIPMEGESLNCRKRRNAFDWLEKYIHELGERGKMTGNYNYHGFSDVATQLLISLLKNLIVRFGMLSLSLLKKTLLLSFNRLVFVNKF